MFLPAPDDDLCGGVFTLPIADATQQRDHVDTHTQGPDDAAYSIGFPIMSR